MEIVATYTDEQALRLAQDTLRRLGIPHDTQAVEGEEFPTVAVRVAEEHYDRACDAVEALEGLLQERTQNERRPHLCRFCGSSELRRVDEFEPEDSLTGIAILYECMKCGRPNTG